jgi:hypothetical protein
MNVIRISLIAGAMLALASRADAGVLYAATSAGTTGELYILNQTNGTVIQDIGPLNDVAGLNYPITGLAFNPISGVLYGSTGNNPLATAGMLVRIDPATAQVTQIGLYNAGPTDGAKPATMADIDFDSAGNLYGVTSVGGPSVYSINAATGQATLVGANGASTSTSGGGLAISGSGVFYGTPTSSRFGTYNSTSGVYTNISNPAKPAGTGAYTALSFDGSVLYGLNTGPGSPPPTHIVTIDLATGTVADIAASVNSLDAIAFRPVPEPASALLLVLAAMPLGLRRIKR